MFNSSSDFGNKRHTMTNLLKDLKMQCNGLTLLYKLGGLNRYLNKVFDLIRFHNGCYKVLITPQSIGHILR